MAYNFQIHDFLLLGLELYLSSLLRLSHQLAQPCLSTNQIR
jgi:hypothetical protein